MTNPFADLDLSAGSYVKGVKLNENTFLATTAFKQLRTITRDPDVLQPGSKRGNDDPRIADERAMHELIQRAMAGNKKSNVPRYMGYIERLVHGQTGVLPPIDLWSARHLEVVTAGQTTYILVPNGEYLFAIDGETQLAAHHSLARMGTIPTETRELHQNFPLAAVMHHGLAVQTARQYFYDLNVLAVRPNTSLGLAMNTQDPVMQIVNDVEVGIDLLAGRVDKMSRQLPKKSNKIVTLQSLRQMVVNVARGISGVQYGARPAPVDDISARELSQVATDWLSDYFATFEHEIINRDEYLAGSGPVLAAVGAMGNALLTTPPEERSTLRAELTESLREIDWSKGGHWLGIAGNYTSTGVFSVKGTKEVAYAVYNAITDSANPGFAQIRSTTRDNPSDLTEH